MSYDEDPPAAAGPSGAFFAGAHAFDIYGAEFINTTGDMHSTITYDDSVKSDFSNRYGREFRGSRNNERNYYGGFQDHRQFESRRYEANLNHNGFARGRGQPQFNPNYQHYGPGAGSPRSQQQQQQQEPYYTPTPPERPPTAPMLESRSAVRQRESDQYTFNRAKPSSASPGPMRSPRQGPGPRPVYAEAERNTWNPNKNPNQHQNANMHQAEPRIYRNGPRQQPPPSPANMHQAEPRIHQNGPRQQPRPSPSPHVPSSAPEEKITFEQFTRSITEPVLPQSAPVRVSPEREPDPTTLRDQAAAAAERRRRVDEESEDRDGDVDMTGPEPVEDGEEEKMPK